MSGSAARLSARNPKVQRLRRLARDRRERSDERAFVLEGPHAVGDAIEHAHLLESVFVEPGGEAPLGAGSGLSGSGLSSPATPVYEVEPGTLAKVTDTVSPQGIVAIAPIPSCDDDIAEQVVGAGGVVLVLAGVGDPGNAGTLVRIAEAAGVGAVLFCDDAVDPFAPKCVRASAGSILHLPVTSGARSVHVLQAVRDSGGRRIGAGAGRGQRYDRADLTGGLAIVLGSEAHGIPADAGDALDGWTHVPMAGRVESLNVAVTGAVVCFEAARQRAVGSGA